MSGSSATHADSIDHGHNHDDHHDNHGSMRDYTIGFVLSVILTVIPFYVVMVDTPLSINQVIAVVMGLGTIQVFVHMIYFLHMNSKSEGGWTLMALIFTVIIVAIALAGSLWVMYQMNEHMMPETPEAIIQKQ